jgi:hypothetical protein
MEVALKEMYSLLASVSRAQPVTTRVYNRHFSYILLSKLPKSKFIPPEIFLLFPIG